MRIFGLTYIHGRTIHFGANASACLGDHMDLGLGESGLLFPNPNGIDVTDTYSIDSAMESFLAEFICGDWGWDPFSGTAAL